MAQFSLPQAKVRAIAVVTRKGVLVGTLPPGASLPASIAKYVAERDAKDNAEAEHPQEGEDPF